MRTALRTWNTPARSRTVGKRKGKRQASADVAERHEFQTGGILGHDSGDYAINVSERTALGIDAVFACVVRLADAIADAEVGEWRGTERLPDSRLVQRPMGTLFRGDWLWQVTAILALYTKCYLRKQGIAFDGTPLSLVPIIPTRLSKVHDTLLLDGKESLRWDELIVLRRAVWPTLTDDAGSLIKLAREVFAAAWAQGAYTADFWENGGSPILQIVTDQPLTNTEADNISDRYANRRQTHPGRPAVFGKGAELKPLGVDLGSASDPGTDRVLASVARFFGMQPWLVNVPSAAGSMVYSNTEAAGLDLVRYTLSGYRRPIEDGWSEALPGNYLTGRRVRLGMDHLTRPGTLERAQAYAIATGSRPWMEPAEVRAREGMPPNANIDLPAAGAGAPAIESIPVEV